MGLKYRLSKIQNPKYAITNNKQEIKSKNLLLCMSWLIDITNKPTIIAPTWYIEINKFFITSAWLTIGKKINPIRGKKTKGNGNRANIGFEFLISTNKAQNTKIILTKFPHSPIKIASTLTKKNKISLINKLNIEKLKNKPDNDFVKYAVFKNMIKDQT